MAVEAASFSTEMDSMSSGLSDSKKLSVVSPSFPSLKYWFPDSGLFEGLMGMPSITNNGSLPALMEVSPRILNDEAPPGWALTCFTRNPAAFPCRACATVECVLASIDSMSMVDTAAVSDFFFCVP